LAAVQANFYFLVPNGEVSIPQQTAILPFDYASVKVIYKNVSFSFTEDGVRQTLRFHHVMHLPNYTSLGE